MIYMYQKQRSEQNSVSCNVYNVFLLLYHSLYIPLCLMLGRFLYILIYCMLVYSNNILIYSINKIM